MRIGRQQESEEWDYVLRGETCRGWRGARAEVLGVERGEGRERRRVGEWKS